MADVYRDDLAFIHDVGFGHFARGAAEVLLRELGGRPGLVIDLGCGSGILSEAVATAGHDVLGIDLSDAFIALARRRVPTGEFRVGSILSAELPPCAAVAAVGECLNYVFEESHSDEGVRRVFARVFEALRPGGYFLFDVAEPGRVPGTGPHTVFKEADDWAVVAVMEEERGILTRRITSFRKVGELYRRDHEVHRQRLWPRELVLGWLGEAGFDAEVLASYGPVPFAPGHVGFLARRPARPRIAGLS